MTSLHHERPVDDGQPVTRHVPAQRLGKRSLTDRAKAARTAAAGSAAARTAGAKAVTARTAAAKFATRATTAAKAATATAAARTAPSRTRAATAPRTTAVPPVTVVEPVVAVEPAAVEPAVAVEPAAEPVEAEVAPVAAVAFVDEALADLPAEAASAPAAGDRPLRGRHRIPTVRRRPALYLAAGLVGALSLGALLDTDPAARAEAGSGTETMSVAEQLGIDAEATATLTGDAESTRLLQEMVVSRNERDAATLAAADAQAAADVQAMVSAAQQFAAAAEAARPKVVAPINGARLTSTFGARWGTLHAGIDLAAPMRTPEYSVMDGVVLEAGPASGYGLAVYIQHDDGEVTVYGHMDEILVEPGQLVRAGDTIALLGNRGQSTGPHLHFEVHQGGMDGTKVDPLSWLRERGVQI
jgi:murein DD-endopeptidase MepM/ murein hydrolase activator NlpD